MRFILPLLLIFSISCKVSKPKTDGEKLMSMTMDLSSINFSQHARMIPATFETVPEEITMIDKVVMDGYYTEQKKTRLVKDAYKSIRPIINQGTIEFGGEALLKYNGHEDVMTKERTEDYISYQYCPTCDEKNGLSFKEVHKAIGTIPLEEGMPYKTMVSKLKLYENAKLEPVYKEGTKIITVTGTKTELKKLLEHPKLEGIEYTMEKI